MDLTPARGTRDLLPSTVAVRDHVLARITEVYRRYGYQRIETPALENIERLQGGQGGENQKLIYQVLRRGLEPTVADGTPLDRKSTRLNSSHLVISYAVFCWKAKKRSEPHRAH